MNSATADRSPVNPAALEAELLALGVACSVEVRDRLALVVPRGDHSRLADPDVRREAVRLAESHGFTHLALELAESLDTADSSGRT